MATKYRVAKPKVAMLKNNDRSFVVSWTKKKPKGGNCRIKWSTVKKGTKNKKYGAVSHAASITADTESKYVDGYDIEWWQYKYTDTAKTKGKWFQGGVVSNHDRKPKNEEIKADSDALVVKARVKPNPKEYTTYTVSGKKGSYSYSEKKKDYFKGAWSSFAKYYFKKDVVLDPEQPEVSVDEDDGLSITVSSSADDEDAKTMQFFLTVDVPSGAGPVSFVGDGTQSSGKIALDDDGKASYTFIGQPSLGYTSYCVAYSGSGGTASEQSEKSDYVYTLCSAPTNVAASAIDSESMRVTWSSVQLADGYAVEYATDPEYFTASPGNVKSVTIEEGTTAILTDLEANATYYARVSATNNSGLEGMWSDPTDGVGLGEAPGAPTVGASSEDFVIRGRNVTLFWSQNSDDEDVEIKEAQVSVNGSVTAFSDGETSHTIGTDTYSDGDAIVWKARVRGSYTGGDNEGWSEWSEERTITVYDVPTVAASADGYGKLPLALSLTTSSSVQKPLTWDVLVRASKAHAAQTRWCEPVAVAEGEAVWHGHYDSSANPLNISLASSDIDLTDGQSYYVEAYAEMDSGLTAKTASPLTFEVAWDGYAPSTPDASMSINRTGRTASIASSCSTSTATLSTYRENADGSYTLVGTGKNAYDDYPTFNRSSYRVVARASDSCLQSYIDVESAKLKTLDVVIEFGNETLVLPYNVQLSESTDPDVNLNEYIGRSDYVPTYGTVLRRTYNWSCEFPRNDKERLAAVRRLSVHKGNAYFRDPHRNGFPCQISVNSDIGYDTGAVSVSMTISRAVE